MGHVLALQLDIAWEDPEQSRVRADRLLAAAAPRPGSLVVLPEMFDVGFTMNADLAAACEPATLAWLTATARRTGCTVLAGHARRDPAGRVANQATVVGPTGLPVAAYAKCRPFTPAGEDAHYYAGRQTVVFGWDGVQVAPFICYDLRFPELFRDAVLTRGAELLVVIANWPAARIEHKMVLCRARAIENQAYVLAVNRVGRDPNLQYPGRSILLDPHGNILADAGAEETALAGQIDVESLRAYRREFPALRDAAGAPRRWLDQL